jgi:LmbE family N-acetylglucosaminyl deacetylase
LKRWQRGAASSRARSRALWPGVALFALLALLGGGAATSAPPGALLVVVAHPDDEALGMAGVIDTARSQGRRVYVAIVTNGDIAQNGSESGYCGAASGAPATTARHGLRRNAETVAATSLLGLTWAADDTTSDVFFLGYPDQKLLTIAGSPTAWTGDATGLHRTYAEDGDGSIATCNGDLRFLASDRHSLFSRGELAKDLDLLLSVTNPTDVFTHSVYDGSSDHAETYRQVVAAIQRAAITTTLHATLIHPEGTEQCLPLSSAQWPNPAVQNNDPYARFTPTIDVTAPPTPTCSSTSTGSSWGTPGPPNELLEVPATMQVDNEATNLKWRVLSNYETQIDGCNPETNAHITCGYMRAFVKRHEFFWRESFAPGNTPPTVAVTKPSGGATFSEPASIDVEATASDADGSIATVDFLVNGAVVGSDASAPYSFSWTGVAAGSYTITARAQDNGDATTVSAPIPVTVTAAGPPAASGTGLRGEYYDNTNFSPLRLTRIDPTVDFAWGTGSPDPSVAPDTFSVRWTGQVEPRFTETHSFYTVSDDGVRLWVDGRLLIDNWTHHAPTENSGTIALVAGQRYDIRMDFFEGSSGATARLLWSSASQAKQTIPQAQLYPPAASAPPTATVTAPAAGATFTAPATIAIAANASDTDGTVARVEFLANGSVVGEDTTSPYTFSWSGVAVGSYNLSARAVDNAGAVGSSTTVPVTVEQASAPPPGTGTGLLGDYFDNSDLTSLRASRIDATVDFDWGTGSPDASIAADTFSAQWNGRVEPRFSETYTFYTVSDDGVRLWVDGRLVIDNWTFHAPTENSGTIALVAGQQYDIELEYFEGSSGAVAKLLWSSASQPKQIIPQTQLYPPGLANERPTVAITSPLPGASYTAPASIDISASAADSDGTIARVEFLVDGSLLASDTTAPYQATWSLAPAGDHELVAHAFDNLGAVTSSAPVSVAVQNPSAPPPGTGDGLAADYFDNSDLTNLRLSRVDPTVNFDWGVGSPDPAVGPDSFSVRWTGQVEPRFTETYTFATISDDGVRLWVNGQLLVNNWTLHPPTENSGSIPLVAGQRYDVRMEFYEGTSGATAKLLWSSANQPKQVIPQSQLYASASSNQKPTATILSPVTGSTFTAPATIAIDVAAADGDGSIDRVEFFANGTLIGTDSTAPYALAWSGVPSGSYSLTARAFDDGGASGTSSPTGVAVESAGTPAPGSGTGLRGEYYDNSGFTSLRLTRTDAVVDFAWGEGSPDPSLGVDTFSVRWTGRVEPRFSETYTFYTVSDDGVRLTVNGQRLVDNWTLHPPTENSGTITLVAGQRYDIQMEFFENTSGATVRLLWSSPSQAKQPIPQTQLYPPS